MQIDQYAVIGNPIKHSKSPQIHTLFAQQTQQSLEYRTLLAETTTFADVVHQFRDEGGLGLNVTVPFKQQAFQLATELSARAQLAGAVNTLHFKGGAVVGDVTDGVGLIQDLTHHHAIALADKNVLILGAGGAVRGILSPLLETKPAQIVIANRTLSNAQALVDLFKPFNIPMMACNFAATPMMPYHVVINGTSLSLQGDAPPLDPKLVNQAICYDMMYAKEPTVFMQWAMQHRARQTIDGLGMLVEQAAESFYLWRGVRPDVRQVMQVLRK